MDASSPYPHHQKIYLRLLLAIQQWIDADGSGMIYPQPMDLKIDSYRTLVPDLSYYLTSDAAAVENQSGNYLNVAPDLVVEIVSPSSASTDRGLQVPRLRRNRRPLLLDH